MPYIAQFTALLSHVPFTLCFQLEREHYAYKWCGTIMLTTLGGNIMLKISVGTLCSQLGVETVGSQLGREHHDHSQCGNIMLTMLILIIVACKTIYPA